MPGSCGFPHWKWMTCMGDEPASGKIMHGIRGLFSRGFPPPVSRREGSTDAHADRRVACRRISHGDVRDVRAEVVVVPGAAPEDDAPELRGHRARELEGV